MFPDPLEMIVVRTERSIRVCLAYDGNSVAEYANNILIDLGIQKSIHLLRQYYGQQNYLVQRESVERTSPLTKVILDLKLLF